MTARGRAFRLARLALTTFLLLELALRLVRFAGLGGSVLYLKGEKYWLNYGHIEDTRELAESLPFALGPYANAYGYILNSRGFRTAETPYERTPGKRRIVLLGDSFLCVPGGPDDGRHVANLVSEGLGAEVVNLGLPYAGTGFYLRVLEIEGVRYSPDAVVVFVFTGNDFLEEVDLGQRASPLPVYSYSWRALSNIVRMATTSRRPFDARYGRWLPGRPRQGGFWAGCPACWPWDGHLSDSALEEIRAEHSVIYRRDWPEYLVRAGESVRSRLAAMREIARVRGIPLLVVAIPDEGQVKRSLREGLLRAPDGAGLDLAVPQRALAGFCAEAGIPFIDLLPAFRSASDAGRELYLYRDTHWSPDGQEIAAKAVTARLRILLKPSR